jgi:hypothetical protein
VVKAYKKGDTTKAAVWSWHIWVTKDDPTANLWDPVENGGGTTKQNVKFMDRNLGALEATLSPASHGLHYQWGRKDPFPLDDDLITIATSGSEETRAIQTPSTFYASSGDWSNDTNNAGWWSASKVKTINDPCPAGFKTVNWGSPTPWEDVYVDETNIDNAIGYSWGKNKKIYIPRTMIRDGVTGKLSENYITGPYLFWTNDFGFITFASYVNFAYTISKAQWWTSFGFAVRCVKE